MVTDFIVKAVLSIVFGLESFYVCGVREAEAEGWRSWLGNSERLEDQFCGLQGVVYKEDPGASRKRVQTKKDGPESQRPLSALRVRWDLCLAHCPLWAWPGELVAQSQQAVVL